MSKGWDLLGEDYDAMCHEGHLPLDWRTKAKALLAYAAEIGKPDAIEWLPLSNITVDHGVEHWAAPDTEWWGSTYVSCNKAPNPAPEGWHWSEDTHDDCGGLGKCPMADSEGVICFGGRAPVVEGQMVGDRTLVADLFAAAAAAGPEVRCITTGFGDEWLCRAIGPVTVVSFQ